MKELDCLVPTVGKDSASCNLKGGNAASVRKLDQILGYFCHRLLVHS